MGEIRKIYVCCACVVRVIYVYYMFVVRVLYWSCACDIWVLYLRSTRIVRVFKCYFSSDLWLYMCSVGAVRVFYGLMHVFYGLYTFVRHVSYVFCM